MRFKKLASIVLLFFVVACTTKQYTISFYVDGEIYHQEAISKDEKATAIIEPVKEGYKFVGWFDNDRQWIFSLDKVNNHTKLFARFTTVEVVVEKSSKIYLKGEPDEFTIYKFATDVPGPTIFIIGGIHGDERAGWKAALKLLDYKFFRGTIYILPMANRQAISHEPPVRQVNNNLNRSFPGKINGNSVEILAYYIYSAIIDASPDLVIDLHEARGSYVDGYLGDQIIYNINKYSLYLYKILMEINKLEILQANPNFRTDGPPPDGSINKEISTRENIPVFTIETNRKNFSGSIEDEAISLETRIVIQIAIVEVILKTFVPLK